MRSQLSTRPPHGRGPRRRRRHSTASPRWPWRMNPGEQGARRGRRAPRRGATPLSPPRRRRPATTQRAHRSSVPEPDRTALSGWLAVAATVRRCAHRPGPARPDDGYVGAKIRKRPTPEHPARSRGEAEIIDPGARRVLVKTLPSDSTAVATARNDGRVPRTPSDHEREDSEMFTSQP